MALWHDKRGRFSPLRAATLVLLAAPAIALLYFTLTDNLGPRPFTEALHETGLWAVRFLMLSLLVTPLRRMARWAKLVDVRRMIGVASFLYIALHLGLYIADQAFDLAKVASEIVLRIYLTIGFTAWLGLALLAATSNDYMVRRLGGMRWRKLHWLVYPIGVLALIHYFMQAKLDVFEPTVVAGLFLWMMLYRVAHWTTPRGFRSANGELPLWFILALGIGAAALTFAGEAIGLWLVHGIAPQMVLEVDFTFVAGIRPGWYVLAGGLILFAVALWRLWLAPSLQAGAPGSKSSSLGRTPS
jgi:sulfoxide reductase heme-binding subunit YedZ